MRISVKSLAFMVLALGMLAPTVSQAATMTCRLGTNTADANGGVCYVSRTETEATGSYKTSATTASASSTQTIYLRAFPNFGYEFAGWNRDATSTSYTSYSTDALYSTRGASSARTYYAHFSSGATVKDIYLYYASGKQDSVRLYFYNDTSKSWSAKVNSTFLNKSSTSSTSVSGSYASFAFSRGNQNANRSFDVTVTATATSGDNYDQLTVQDYEGNVYHYRIHVAAQRNVSTGDTMTYEVNSFASKAWSTSGNSTSIATATRSPTTASTTATVTVTGVAEGNTTLTVKNYATGTTTGALGATYTFNVAVSAPKFVYYGQVATEVVGGSSSGAGVGWAYASKIREENSEVYKTIRSETAVLSATSNDASADVGDFYLFAFPNVGYRFVGWSKNDPNGEIVMTDAFHMSPIKVNSSSQNSSSPAVDTYYAHFTNENVTVQDITLAVGDSVRLSFYNSKSDNWSLQVIYTNANAEVVVNLDDTAAHAAGYANFQRSHNVATASNEFSMYVTATAISGNDFDQLTIEDCSGHVYHYRVHVVDPRVVEKDETIAFLANSIASKAWSVTGGSSSVANVSVSSGATSSATVTATGVAKGKSTFTVKNYVSGTAVGALGAEYTFSVNVIEPWPVEFCQGDKVVIYYHNTTPKNWYLLINGNRVEPNVAGDGTQMTVTLTAENPDTDTEILAVTRAVGADGTSDLVVVTDGENFYAYRMGARARRVVEVGESVTMKCSTVATSPWSLQLSPTASQYVDTSFESSLDDGHSARVTITGKEPGADVKMYVYNMKHDDASINAQGAYYTLVTDVTGVRTRRAYVSKGVSVEWMEPYPGEMVYSRYAVTPASANDMSASVKPTNDAHAVWTTLTVNETAAPFTKQLFTVTDTYTTTNVVKYEVTAYGIMSMAVGQVAPGCLVGSDTPWTVWSSDPVNFTVEPVIYDALNSGRIAPQAPGDYWMWATNASEKLSWYAMRCQVYDEHDTIISMPTNSTTNITISAGAGLNGVWNLITNCSHFVASLDNAGVATNEVTLTIVAGAASGTHTLTIQNPFHHETIKLFTGADSERPTVYGGTVQVNQNQYVLLPAACVSTAWTAKVADTGEGKFTCAASGAANEQVRIDGVHAGTGQVIVTTDNAIYVYDVEVLRNTNILPTITVGEGYTFTTNLTGQLAGATVVLSGPRMIADGMAVNNVLSIAGLQEGETEFTLTTADDVYYLPVKVHVRDINKNITLVLGADGTKSTYSYTFDRVVSITNYASDRVAISQLGNTLTFTPLAEGRGAATVECFVDDLPETSFLNYQFTIVREKGGMLVRDFDQGYIAYGNASTVREEDGDLIFVFDKADDVGSFKIPDGYTAKLDILTVGGGGGGGSVATGFGRGGGGGAGGFSLVEDKKLLGGTFGIQVGAGGLGLSGEMGGGISLKGSNGGDSVITNASGFVVALGNGGGGGAAPSDGQYSGDDGGSGGGGSWILEEHAGEATWVPGRGGLGINGQGCNGGTPTETNCGGGGGGAMGNGGDGQTRGPGRYSSISGENVLYSLGGFGGRSDVATPAAAGQGPGFGGDGGNGGPGGDGGEGAVILRFHHLYKNVLVPIPTTNDLVTARFQWEEGTNCVALAYEGRSFRSKTDSHPYNWEDVIADVGGTTNAVCEYDESGTNKLGIGYYNFTIKLKDGFAWESDTSTTYGNTEKVSYRWVVVEDWSNIDAALNVNKTVWWSDKSNATVRVSSTSSPETSGGSDPKVLFLGTLCGAHGLSGDVINTALNAITEVADVDCYFFNSTTTMGDTYVSRDDPPYFTTNMVKGMKINKTDYKGMNVWASDANRIVNLSAASGNHDSMSGFYHQIYNAITNGTAAKYDYVIFSFDRSRLAERFDVAFEHEAEVAEFLKPYYANDKVIWLVDNTTMTTCTLTTPNIETSPWFPANLSYYNGGESLDQGVAHWATQTSQNNYTIALNWKNSGEYAYVPYNALVGLMCPSNYPVDKATYKAHVITGSSTLTYENVMATACPGIANQCVYDNAGNVSNLIASVVKVKPFNLYYKDKIVPPADGLEIQEVYITVCLKGDGDVASTNETDWTQLMHWDAKTGEYVYDDTEHTTGIPGGTMAVDTTNNLVTACLSNISFKVYVRYDTHVLDVDGKFCSSDGANYNQETGQYEKNPNDGRAYLSMIDELGVGIGVEGDAETQVPWRYTAYQIAGTAQNGSIFVAGTKYSTLSCAEGRDVTVYYRGNGGYRLASLKVDSNDIPIDGTHDNYYTFENLSANHTITAIYTPYYGTVTPMASTNVYDGIAHVPHVQLDGWDATYPTQLRYSITPDGEYYTEAEFAEMYSTNRELVCVGEHTVYCRAYAYQPGYGETLEQAGWVWVDTRVIEQGTVTVTKAPLTMTAVSFMIKGEEVHPAPLDRWQGVTISGLVEGDTVNTNDTMLTYSCPDYQQKEGQYQIDPVKVAGKTDEDLVGINYELFLRPGVVSVEKGAMIFDGVQQFGGLDPEDYLRVDTGVDRVEKIYDGVETNLVLEIDTPLEDIEGGRRIFYSYDDGRTWTTEVRTFFTVGTNKVWYAVEAGEDYESSVYFWVTNYNYVIINPRPITIAAASAIKRYDTLPLATNGYGIVAGSLAEGDALVRVDVAGSQTVVGTSANVASNAVIACPNDSANSVGGREEDYAITYLDGTLTVTPGALVINGVTYSGYVPSSENGVSDVVKTYDGIGTNIIVWVDTPAAGYTLLYSTNTVHDEVWTWSPDPLYTNVGVYAVHFMVAAENYQTVTNTAFVTINPRAVTVKVLDAHLHTNDPLPEQWPTTVTYSDTGEAVPPDIASTFVYTVDSTNRYDVGTHDLVVTSGETLQGNYEITYIKGTLTVDDRTPILYEAPPVSVVYDGTGHVPVVTVTNSVPGEHIQYSLSEDGPWSDTLPTFTNASSTVVYFHITSTDPTVADTIGSTVVEITLKPVTVTVDNKTKIYGEPDPELTATMTALADADTNKTGIVTYTITREPGETNGTYAITATGGAQQNNYAITYIPGTMTVYGYTSLWICDHEDAGGGNVYLAFKPETDAGGPSALSITNLAAQGRIKVAVATNETELASVPTVAAPLRDPTAQLDLDKGWVWVTVTVPLELNFKRCFWQVVIEGPQSED